MVLENPMPERLSVQWTRVQCDRSHKPSIDLYSLFRLISAFSSLCSLYCIRLVWFSDRQEMLSPIIHKVKCFPSHLMLSNLQTQRYYINSYLNKNVLCSMNIISPKTFLIILLLQIPGTGP
jgi:hypothetical protein